jgi:hypothetical protein
MTNRTRLVLVIDLENAAFESDPYEAERILRDTADRKSGALQVHRFGDHLIDANGNKVGEWQVVEGDADANSFFKQMLDRNW